MTITCNRDSVENFLFAPINQNVIDTINNNNSFNFIASNNDFRNYVVEMNNYLHSDEYLRTLNMMTMYQNSNPEDISIYLVSQNDWRMGKRMREFLMAEPNIENLTYKGFLEGCAPTENNFINYSLVNDGIVNYEEGYYDQFIVSDYEALTEYEQLDIMGTWKHANDMISNGIDPTIFIDE